MQSEHQVRATWPAWHCVEQAFAESSWTGTVGKKRVQIELKEMPVDVLGKDPKVSSTWAYCEGGTKSTFSFRVFFPKKEV